MKVLVVGAGFSGATVAQQHVERGDQVTVIDKRDHIAGNAFTDNMDGQLVHVYGPHIFHTDSDDVWNYVNRFVKFQRYTHQVRAVGADHKTYSLPFSLLTFNQLFGTSSPGEAKKRILAETKDFRGSDSNVEGWCLKNLGKTLYETLIEGYTGKQWGRDPKHLDSSIIKRLPVRFDDSNADYFNDAHQGIPEGGYTALVETMLKGSEVFLGVSGGPELFKDYSLVYYTGPLDQLNKFELGKLESRSLRFDRYVGETQGCAQLNDCTIAVPHTRTSESWLIGRNKKPEKIWIVKETPDSSAEPAYPINDDKNNSLQQRYVKLSKQKFPNVVPVGRMATFRYLDMHQAIAQALKAVRER